MLKEILKAAFLLAAGFVLGLGVSGCKPIVVEARLAGPLEVKTDLGGPVQVEAQASLATVEYQGTFISEKLFDTIVEGTTTTTYLVALVGEPDRETDLEDGDTLWVYRYAPTEQTASLVSLLGGDGGLDPRFVTNVFRIRGGVIQEKLRG